MFEQVEAFHRPASVREAARLLSIGKGRARIVAGGTDLVVEGDSTVRALIDITHSGLSYIRERGGRVEIGAATVMAELRESRVIRALAGGILARAAAACGSVQIQAAATIGGNIAHGSPAADLVTPLLALDARLVLADSTGRRTLPLADYLAARGTRPLRRAIVVAALVAAAKSRRCGWSFQKLGRTELDISLVNVAAGLGLDRAGRIEWVRIALGAVAPTVMRASSLEEQLRGRTLDRSAIADAAAAVREVVRPLSDVRAPAEYRREMSGVLTGRALEECAAEARCAL